MNVQVPAKPRTTDGVVERLRLEILPKAALELYQGAALSRGMFGGRGSGKTRCMHTWGALAGYMHERNGGQGQILLSRETLKSIDQSSLAEVKAVIRSHEAFRSHFIIGEKFVKTVSGRVVFTPVGLKHNIDAVKSQARVLANLTDEAEKVSDASWRKLRPVLREEGEGWNAENHACWNPESRYSATHIRWRMKKGPLDKVIEVNWRDNPWWTRTLNLQRLDDLVKYPEVYDHIWEGGFLEFKEGAFFADEMAAAKRTGRICRFDIEPHLKTFTFWDLGVDDDTVIWVVQVLGKEIRLVHVISGSGLPMSYYINELHDLRDEHGFRFYGHYAPHDIVVRELTTAKTRLETAGELGIDFQPVERVQHKPDSIEALRRVLPRMWFRENGHEVDRTIEALKLYHRSKNPDTQKFSKHPVHDWTSDYADAGQQMAIAWGELENVLKDKHRPPATPPSAGGWQGT